MCTTIRGTDGDAIQLKWHNLRRHPDEPGALRTNLAAGLIAGAVMEVDIRLTTDGRWVCLHDAELDDETTGTGSLVTQTGEDLSGVRMRTPTGIATTEPLLFLDDVFEETARHPTFRGEIQLDLKEPASGITDAVLERFAEQIGRMPAAFSLSGTDVGALERLQSAAPELAVTYSCSQLLRDARGDLERRFNRALGELDGRAMVWIQHRILAAAEQAGFDLVSYAHDRGVGVDTGTIDLGAPGGREALALARRAGVDRITTNAPCELSDEFGQASMAKAPPSNRAS